MALRQTLQLLLLAREWSVNNVVCSCITMANRLFFLSLLIIIRYKYSITEGALAEMESNVNDIVSKLFSFDFEVS